MLPIQNGLICWLDASDGKAGETLLKDRTSYGHNLVLENFQQGYGFTGKSIKVKKSGGGSTIGNALYIANGGFKTHCKSFCLCIERNNTSEPWYIFDGRGLSGQGSGANHCYNGNTGESYDKSKTRKDGILTQYNAKLETDKKVFFYFELNTAELFTLSILMRYTKNESPEGQFYSLYAYNRALTEQEILHNMEYEKNKISYVNDKNLPKIVEKLSDASNIKITGNKYGNRVQTVIDKIVEKADNVTKAINQEVINNTHLFKAGKGNNVDVSLDAQNGFSALAIKGETYQNILNFDSDITFNLTLENWCIKALPLDSLKVKPNTVYTMVVYVSKVTTTHQELLWVGDVSGRKDTITDEIVRKNVVLGINTFKFTTNSNPQNKPIKFQGSKFVEGTLIFKALLLEGDHTNNVNLPSYFNGIVGVGNVNKNLLNPSTFSPSNGVSIKDGVLNINLLTDGGQRTIYSGLNIPKGIYTVTIEVIEGNYAGGNLIFYNSSNTKYSEVRISGRHVVNTGDNDINKLTLWAIRGVCKLRIQIEKGSIATLYEPYHNGYKVEVVTTGKNLCCAKTVNQDWEFGDSMDTWISSNNLNYHSCEAFAIPHLANKKIYAGLIRNGLAHSDNINFAVIYDKNRVRIGSRFGIPNTGYTLPANAYYIRLMHYAGNSSTLQYIYKDDYYLGLEPITKNAAYEPYQEEKTQILLNEPLMKLPNGVCDEITKDGKLVRRIGKIVLNGNEAWFNNGPWSGGDYQACYIRISNKGGNKLDLVCDKFGVTSQKTNSSNQVTNECCFGEVGNGVLYLIISKQKLSTPDMSGLKRWLSDNPTTVYYELSNPIITDLNNQIKIFKDGHLTFNTLVAPESTHIVQLNKSAQIHNAIKQSQLLDNKIAVLENNYDSLMLSTMSTLNDLEFDYTLK